MRDDLLPHALLFSLLVHGSLAFYPMPLPPAQARSPRIVLAMQTLERPRPPAAPSGAGLGPPNIKEPPREKASPPKAAPLVLRPAAPPRSPAPENGPRRSEIDGAPLVPAGGGAAAAENDDGLAVASPAADSPPLLEGSPPPGPSGSAVAPEPGGGAQALPPATAPSAPPRPPPPPKADQQVLAADYAALVKRSISAEVRYPPGARSEGLEGVVAIRLVLDRRGRIVSLSAEGTSILAKAAQEAVRRAAPFPPLPPGIEGPQILLKIPIRYRLEEMAQ